MGLVSRPTKKGTKVGQTSEPLFDVGNSVTLLTGKQKGQGSPVRERTVRYNNREYNAVTSDWGVPYWWYKLDFGCFIESRLAPFEENGEEIVETVTSLTALLAELQAEAPNGS